MQEVKVLLVEDNPADIDLVRESLEESKLIIDLSVVMDGEEAIKFLKKEENYSASPTPDLVLLDWNLPKKNGLDVLKEIKQDKRASVIPIVVLTSSEADIDILSAYEEHANCYIRKPLNLLAFEQIIRAIDYFWFSIVKLPTNLER